MRCGINLILVFGVLALFIPSCENKEVPMPLSPKAGTASCDTTNLTYSSSSNTMKGIINTYCAISGCHVPGGSAPTDYTSYTSLKPYATNGTFTYFLFGTSPPLMPLTPRPPLDACIQAKFRAWLNAGAPQ